MLLNKIEKPTILFKSISTPESGDTIYTKLPGIFTSGWKLISKLVLSLVFIIAYNHVSAQNDLANPTSNLVTIPAGSFVIPMDSLNYYTSGPNTVFNVNAYGLIFTLLNNKVGIHWFIKAGKSKDGIDFTANLQKILPSSGTAANYNLRAGPMVIYPRDTAGVRSIINSFNTTASVSLTGRTRTKVNIYRTTTSVSADLRYILTQIPSVAVLNDGNNASIQTSYFTDANIPPSNHSIISGVSLMSGCYTIASQPHNNTALQSNLDSIQSFLNQGGNFFAQCKGVFTYENFTPSGGTPGFFQTTEGITLDNVNTSLSYPNPDVGYNQFLGSFNSTIITGSEQVWYLSPAVGATPASTFKNNGYTTVSNGTPASGTQRYEHISASAAKIKTNTTAGSMMFYAGGHDYSASKGSSTDFINGERLYFNAMLTPCGTRSFCNILFFDIDMNVGQIVPTCYSYGDTLTLKVWTKNNGPSSDTAKGVVVTDTIPGGWTYISSSATSGSYNSSTGKWTLGNMVYHDSETLTIKMVARTYTNKSMSATVLGKAYDQNNTNDTSKITIYAAPLANTAGNKSICKGQSTQIGSVAVSGDTYSWISSPTGFTSTSANPAVSPTTTTSYTLTETNPTTGCAKSNDLVVTVYPLPAAAVIATDTICTGTSVSIGAASVAGSTYSWTSIPAGFSSASSNPPVNAAINTTYTLTETNMNGCVKSNSVMIVLEPAPNPSITGDNAICEDSTAELYLAPNDPGDSYLWTLSGGTIQSGQNTNAVNIKWGNAGIGIISVKETDPTYGCSTTVSKNVTIYTKPGMKLILH